MNKDDVKKQVDKYVENGKLEQGLNKVNDQVKKKKGKDSSKYIDKAMGFLKKNSKSNSDKES